MSTPFGTLTLLRYVQPLALAACLAWCGWLHVQRPKIAYVRSGIILDKYAGIVEARQVYQSKVSVWQAQLDTLDHQWQYSLAAYEKEYSALSASRRASREAQLTSQERALQAKRAELQEKAKAEEEKFVRGSLGQINSYIEQYGQSRGYTVVLGTTETGNLLYASDAVDITDEVIRGLNQQYK